MKNKKIVGHTGEDIAAAYLRRAGYEILTRNFTCDIGEIDIVAAGDGYIVFVEVKARSGEEFGRPAEAVDASKQRKLSQVAAKYISQKMLYDSAVRFDVIEVGLDDKKVNHIIDAFESYLRY